MKSMKSFSDFNIDAKRNSGLEYTTCPECSNSRSNSGKRKKCLSVSHENKWFKCNHCGFKGTLYDKFSAKAKEFSPPQTSDLVKISEKFAEWFFVKRKISAKTLESAGVRMKGDSIAFVYYENEQAVNVKFRTLNKNFYSAKNGKKILYNIDSISEPKTKFAIICEGEIDCLTYLEAGISQSVSIPGGVPPVGAKELDSHTEWIDNCADYLELLDKIYLSFDSDVPGQKYRDEVARRLGKNRCYVIDYPGGCKDINDVLQQFGKESVVKCFLSAKPYPVYGVFEVEDFKPELQDLYNLGYPKGAKTNWDSFNRLIRFSPGQLTVITGIPSHGKSTFVSNIACQLMKNEKWIFSVFSPEKQPFEYLFAELSEILIGKKYAHGYNTQMDHSEAISALAFLQKQCKVLAPERGGFTIDSYLDTLEGQIKKYGCNAAILDPFNRLEHHLQKGETETIYISRLIDKLTDFIKYYSIHFFLIAHPTKIQNERIPSLYDVAGSANFFNKTDNGFTVFRQREDRDGQIVDVCTKIIVQKIRNDWEGKVGACEFIYQPENKRFRQVQDYYIDLSNWLK